MLSKTVTELYGGRANVAELGSGTALTKSRAGVLFPSQSTLPSLIGIEVEIEQAGNPGAADETFWRAVPDNSLRNGIELVSYPLNSPQVYKALAALDIFFTMNVRSVFSHRCSNHVHINVSNCTKEQLLVMVGFYLTVEGLFFDTFFPTRKGNNYCYPLVSTQLEIGDISRDNLSRDVWKYAAINLYHLRDYGTIEFRQHPGTKDVTKLLEWIKTISNIYTYGTTTRLDEFLTVLKELNTTSGYHEYVRKALPDWPYPIDADSMYDGVTAAKYFLMTKGYD